MIVVSDTYYDADVPGMVNMLILNSTVAIANPNGPGDVNGGDIFKKDVEARLNWLTVHFVDNWHYYHALEGEVHCGTNVKRIPHSKNWWDH